METNIWFLVKGDSLLFATIYRLVPCQFQRPIRYLWAIFPCVNRHFSTKFVFGDESLHENLWEIFSSTCPQSDIDSSFYEVGFELNPLDQKQIILRKKFVDYAKCRPSYLSDFWFEPKILIWYIRRYCEHLKAD